MSAAERFAKGAVLASATQPERDLQGVCHELLEIIEGQEYIIEDAQFAENYGDKAIRTTLPAAEHAKFEEAVQDMIRKMQEVKVIAEDLFRNTFNCRRVRERAGFEVER